MKCHPFAALNMKYLDQGTVVLRSYRYSEYSTKTESMA